jgi:outer membrane protein insertion porin family
MMVWFLALLLLLFPAPGLAQMAGPRPGRKAAVKKAAPKNPEVTQWPIESLVVEGNKNYTQDQILAVAGLKIGQTAGKADFEAARDRLAATGFFETVGYRFAPTKESTGYAASFQVVEVTPLYNVQFAGLPVNAAELNAWMKSKEPLYGAKLPATTEVLGRYTKLVQDFLTSKNQTEKVMGRLLPTGIDQFAIMFRSAAPLPTIAQVAFTGNQVLPATLLQNKISEVAIGYPFTEASFRTLLDHAIRPLYDARGRVSVAFRKIATEKAKDVDGLAVTVAIDEGQEFKLGEVRFAGNNAARSTEWLKLGKFKTGEIANFDEVGQGIDRIKKRLRRQGYLRAEATVERTIHDKPKTVDATIRLEEGPLFNFGKLTIEGLDLNAEAAIRKLWGIQPGKPFDAEYPDYFLARIREEGYFDNLHNTKASTKTDEPNHSVDVTLQFK